MKPMPRPSDGPVKRLVDAEIARLEGKIRDYKTSRESLQKALDTTDSGIAECEKELAELREFGKERDARQAAAATLSAMGRP